MRFEEKRLEKLRELQAKCEADPTCEVDRKKAEQESLRQANYPVTVLFTSPAHRAQYESVICETHGKPLENFPQSKQAECKKGYSENYFAKLIERYPLARVNQIDVWCKANPIECRKLENIEDQYRDSNAGMNSMYRDERNSREATEERAHKEHIFRSISNALGRGRGSFCTTKQVGNTVYQRCD